MLYYKVGYTERYGRLRGGHAAKSHGQESNPDRCDQDWALKVRALPGEPPGRPQPLYSERERYPVPVWVKYTQSALPLRSMQWKCPLSMMSTLRAKEARYMLSTITSRTFHQSRK